MQIKSIPALRYQNPPKEREFYPFAAHAASVPRRVPVF
jgi:hypothetical protein